MTGEIDVIHYRWRTGRLVSCGSSSVSGTNDPVAVTCPECREIVDRAEVLARVCGCRSVQVHAVTASLQIQNEARTQ